MTRLAARSVRLWRRPMRTFFLFACISALALLTGCGGGDSTADVVARLQLDGSYDLAVVRVDEPDLTPSLLVCRVAHDERPVPDPGRCAGVDPWQWSRRSIAANLDPGPGSSLLVVTHEQAQFHLVETSSLTSAPTVELYLPAGPIGSLAPLTLRVMVAESDLSADHAVGCLATGLGDGTNPVFIAARATPAEASDDDTTADVAQVRAPDELQTACL